MQQIFVFITSVTSPAAVLRLKPALDRLVAPEGHWNFDLQDHEHILRVASSSCQPEQVMETLRREDYFCVELDH